MPSKSLSLTQQKPHLNTNRSFVTSLVSKFQLILIRHWKTCHSSMWEFMSSCHDFAPIKSKLWLVKFNITQKIRKYFLRILVLLAQSICCILPFWRLLNNGVFHRPLGILNLILFEIWRTPTVFQKLYQSTISLLYLWEELTWFCTSRRYILHKPRMGIEHGQTMAHYCTHPCWQLSVCDHGYWLEAWIEINHKIK